MEQLPTYAEGAVKVQPRITAWPASTTSCVPPEGVRLVNGPCVPRQGVGGIAWVETWGRWVDGGGIDRDCRRSPSGSRLRSSTGESVAVGGRGSTGSRYMPSTCSEPRTDPPAGKPRRSGGFGGARWARIGRTRQSLSDIALRDEDSRGPDVGYGPLNAVADGSRAWGGVRVLK